MRVGNVDGKGTVYDDEGRLILRPAEKTLAKVDLDNIDISEGSSALRMNTLFDSTAEKGTLFVTDQRLVFLRKPDPFLAAKNNLYPVGLPDALADSYKATLIKKAGGLEFCEIELREIEGFWVKKRTYGVLFLKSPPDVTRKAILYQRGPEDNKFVVLKRLLENQLPTTAPEDRKGNFLLGSKYPFARRRR